VQNYQPEQQAKAYQIGGASAISVLTDEHFFAGHLEHITLVKEHVDVPILRKDFIIDPYQVYETKAAGADIILLIAKILSPQQIEEMSKIALDLNLDVLIEIHESAELEKITNFDPFILGINNRNLETFRVDLNHSVEVKSRIPSEVVVISESGIKTIHDCLILANHGFRGALIGEALMRSHNPQTLLKEWTKRMSHVYTT
jgi:indole-3-glycerol phosphate synthase